MAILISFINLIIDLDESVHPSLRNGEAFIGYESRMLFLFTRLLLATFFLPIFLLFVIFIIITREATKQYTFPGGLSRAKTSMVPSAFYPIHYV
jgi:hypothetical protein